MKVRMKAHILGTRDGVRWPAVGGVVDLPDDEGARMCARGFAVPVVEDKVEKAVPAKSATEKRADSPATKSTTPRRRKV